MSNKEQAPQLTAAQRLMGLEQSFRLLDQAIGNLANQVGLVKDGLMMMNEKQEAIIAALSTGVQVTNETIDQIIENKRVSDMKEKVQNLVSQNRMSPSDAVTKMSFLAVREINTETGEVINPRVQFAVGILNDESKEKIIGKKVGDSVKLDDNNPASLEIEEIYEITMAKAEDAQPEAAADVQS